MPSRSPYLPPVAADLSRPTPRRGPRARRPTSPRIRLVLATLLATLGLTCAVPQAPTYSSSTLRFVWTGDLNPLWHPAGYQTF